MICNLCKKAGDYYSKYKITKDPKDLLDTRQMHWLCSKSPRANNSCFCGHRFEEITEQ